MQTVLLAFVMFLLGLAVGMAWILMDRERWHRPGGVIAMENADELERLKKYMLGWGFHRGWTLGQFLSVDLIHELEDKLDYLRKLPPFKKGSRPDLRESEEKIAALLAHDSVRSLVAKARERRRQPVKSAICADHATRQRQVECGY